MRGEIRERQAAEECGCGRDGFSLGQDLQILLRVRVLPCGDPHLGVRQDHHRLVVVRQAVERSFDGLCYGAGRQLSTLLPLPPPPPLSPSHFEHVFQ